MTDTTNPQQPIRKGLLPTTPPPEWEFSSAFATGPEDAPGLLLVPGDAGPVVVRRRVTYGDWEPVRPDRWAPEPPSDARAAVPVPASAPTDQAVLRDRIADALAEADGWQWAPGFDKTRSTVYPRYQSRADAVLAELPETVRLHDQILTLQAELAKVRDLLRTENERANAAIDRETTAEEAEEEQRLALSQALGLGTGAPWDAIRDRGVELTAPDGDGPALYDKLANMFGGPLPWPPQTQTVPVDSDEPATVLHRVLADAARSQHVGASLQDCPACQPETDSADGGAQQPETQADDETRLAKVQRWVTSEVVTAKTEFGDGYRAALRDIRDVIRGRYDYDPRAAHAPAAVSQPGKEA
jgi:hypothetical protein